ncbi:MAG: hypothetical protein A2X50_11855 [Candidatus Rokubacteria bacterium GWF2_70_14]|nr:MAG: hypothetical protein A2X50_11855 [Candidatus Rokubacteria bacterium GWF2_70_14]
MQVSVLIAPVPSQCAQRVYGAGVATVLRPPQMQQVEREDMMSNGSVPLPRQKAQTTCSSRGVFPVSVDGMILFTFHSIERIVGHES